MSFKLDLLIAETRRRGYIEGFAEGFTEAFIKEVITVGCDIGVDMCDKEIDQVIKKLRCEVYAAAYAKAFAEVNYDDDKRLPKLIAAMLRGEDFKDIGSIEKKLESIEDFDRRDELCLQYGID